MIDYDPQQNPPTPAVRVRIMNPATGQFADLTALIDTGASISVVPMQIVGQLGLKSVGRIKVRGFEGQGRIVSVYSSTWVVAEYVLVGVEFAGAEGRGMLLGRDVLQHFILTLDGKAGKFALVDP